MRTLFIGLLVGFGLYGAGIALPWLWPGESSTEQWASVIVLAVSLFVTTAWFVAVRRGWRIGKGETRTDKKLKERLRAEREKKRRMFR